MTRAAPIRYLFNQGPIGLTTDRGRGQFPMQQDYLDGVEITEPEELIQPDRSGLMALVLSAISGGSVVGLIWLFSVVLS